MDNIKFPRSIVGIDRLRFMGGCLASSSDFLTSGYHEEDDEMATKVRGEENEWTVPVQRALDRLQELKINFLAIDFDQTIIDTHTGGNWKGTAAGLLVHVRPMFLHLIPAALERNFHVAIVTFSPQVEMIGSLLQTIVGTDVCRKIPIRGGGPHQWMYTGMGNKEGKQGHMASAVEELEQLQKAEITKATTVLMDDDARNIRIALREGVRAIWLNPEKSRLLLQDMQELI